MTGRRSRFERMRANERAKQRGTDDADRLPAFIAPLLRRQRPIFPECSKSEMRARCDAALAEWNVRRELKSAETAAVAAEPASAEEPALARPAPFEKLPSEPAASANSSGATA